MAEASIRGNPLILQIMAQTSTREPGYRSVRDRSGSHAVAKALACEAEAGL
jgi:hypothetical protein